MCAVSAVLDYGQRQDSTFWTPKTYTTFLDLVEQAKRFDHLTGQPDCEDPDKVRFIEALRDLLGIQPAQIT